MLINYIKQEGKTIGVVVALSKDQIGYSICNLNYDKFDKELGKKIAIGRARKHGICVPNLKVNGYTEREIHLLQAGNYVASMVKRAQNYFK